MKKSFFILLLVFAALPIFSEEITTFYVQNNTGFTIRSVYLSPIDNVQWISPVFSGLIYDKQKKAIKLPQPLAASTYNVRFVDIDGGTYSLFKIEIKDNDTSVEVTIGEFDFDN